MINKNLDDVEKNSLPRFMHLIIDVLFARTPVKYQSIIIQSLLITIYFICMPDVVAASSRTCERASNIVSIDSFREGFIPAASLAKKDQPISSIESRLVMRDIANHDVLDQDPDLSHFTELSPIAGQETIAINLNFDEEDNKLIEQLLWSNTVVSGNRVYGAPQLAVILYYENEQGGQKYRFTHQIVSRPGTSDSMMHKVSSVPSSGDLRKYFQLMFDSFSGDLKSIKYVEIFIARAGLSTPILTDDLRIIKALDIEFNNRRIPITYSSLITLSAGSPQFFRKNFSSYDELRNHQE